MKPIVLVKIGGSLITDKNKPFSVKERELEVICGEVKKALNCGKTLILGHGQGSFAHVPAKKYQTHKGIVNEESYRGICEVSYMAKEPNRIVLRALMDCGVNALGFSALSMMTAKNHQLYSMNIESLIKSVELGLLPVVYGDQILDIEAGCTIFSTEKVLGYIALDLKNRGLKIEKVIHCGQTNGVYDAEGDTIPELNSKNIDNYRGVIGGSGGTDVTGGMEHKVFEALELAKQGIPGMIIDGIDKGSLSKAVAGEAVLGTKIEL